MITKAIDFFFYGTLKPQHYQKRNNGSSQPNGNSRNGDVVDGSRKTTRFGMSYSFGNEIRKVQIDGLFLMLTK
jgi:hypothetical protein